MNDVNARIFGARTIRTHCLSTKRSTSVLFYVHGDHINPYMPRYFVNTESPEAKGLPVLANGGLQQTIRGRNTQPPVQ